MAAGGYPSADTQFALRAPHPALRHLVHRYIGYHQDNIPLSVHRGLPSRYLTLVISLAEPIRFRGLPDHSRPANGYDSCLGGLHHTPVLIEQHRLQRGVQLELHPLTAHQLLGLPAAELTRSVIELNELPGNWMRALPDRLAAATNWSNRFAILDETLRAAVEAGPSGGRPAAAEIDWAWQRLRRHRGVLAVTQLADEIGWSRRHFAARFRDHFGLTPKQLARVLRFEHSRTQLLRAPQPVLADIAADCGFHDQAHMTNEWRSLAGCAPGIWLAEERPYLRPVEGEPETQPAA
ncbi:AraC family transcriptional regulator [Tamaricihabitans halophyticus]|uniref:AraC family transcriptional regulator n=1 Tax=Tamaricihabitans halophyticus TaxID=1262583 RepID=A0A4R2QIW5_9PSEU|nr:helix-turn-helix domain-containing protein [Tamaricihabitans halophyticus]TCP49187.1 AraC family transcriptional regulator [Tamaricihabitans halophyticus]